MKFSKRPLLLLRKHRRLGPISLLIAALVAGSANGRAPTSESQPETIVNQFVGQRPKTPRLARLVPSPRESMEELSPEPSPARLLRLPLIDEPELLLCKAPQLATGDSPPPAENLVDVPLVSLLPPLSVDQRSIDQDSSLAEVPSPMLTLPPAENTLAIERNEAFLEVNELEIPTKVAPSSETKPTEHISAATTGALTGSKVNELAQRKIRRGYALAQRGAYYTARCELVEVLRLVSRFHDQKEGVARRTLALAEGLRALEEVEDFAPRGTQLEAEMNLDVVRASHRTRLSDNLYSASQPTTPLLPQQMMNLYFRLAQLKLGDSVAGEPAGSMALHALGKLYSRLEKSEPEKHRLAHRHAVAFQQAALLAHADNHLAGHELGVLLAQSGHFGEAETLLSRVAQREVHPVVLRNLARVQQEMGHSQRAAVTREHATRLAQGPSASRFSNVQWLSPAEFSQAAAQRVRPAAATRAPSQPSSHTAPQPPPAWQAPRTANTGFRLAGKPVFLNGPPQPNRPAPSQTQFGPPQLSPQKQWQ